jgi:hypothetical protein
MEEVDKNRMTRKPRAHVKGLEAISLQNANGSGQFLMVERLAPFSITIAVGHAVEARALHHKELPDERRNSAFVFRFGAALPRPIFGNHPFRRNPGHIIGKTLATKRAQNFLIRLSGMPRHHPAGGASVGDEVQDLILVPVREGFERDVHNSCRCHITAGEVFAKLPFREGTPSAFPVKS